MSRGDQSYVIRGVGLIHTLAQIGSIVVTQVNGTPVLVRDLGRTTLSHQEREGILGKDSNPDTIEGIVLMLKYQNPSQTLRGVHAKVAQLNANLAADDVRIVPYIDRDDLVRATIHKVGQTILEGITLVFLILILFLGSPRSAFVVAVSIPLALVSVFSLLNLTHVSANLLSLGAIDFGILVDGAIVVTEAVLRRREAMPDEELSESEAKAATLQVTRPIFFASLIIITAYLPLFSFERAEAKLFTPMAYTMGYALFGALLTALALVPGLAYLAFRKPGRVYHNRWLERLTVRYDRLLAACLEQPRIIYGVVIFALLAVVGLGATVGRDFLPDLDEGALWLQVQMPTGPRSEQGERHGERPAARDPQVSRRSPTSSRRPVATTTVPIPGPCRTSRRRSDSSRTTPGRPASPRSSSWTTWRQASRRTCPATRSASASPSSTASTT